MLELFSTIILTLALAFGSVATTKNHGAIGSGGSVNAIDPPVGGGGEGHGPIDPPESGGGG